MNPLYERRKEGDVHVLSVDAKNKGGYAESHAIKYGKWHDTNITLFV